jgi:hypothetical protein
VLEALLDLYKQVLLHVEVNSKAEFSDISNEHGIQAQLAELEQKTSVSVAMSDDCPNADQSPASTAEAQARISAKQVEVAYLQRELTNVNSAVDALKLTKQGRQDQVERMAEGYKKIEGSLKSVVAASGPVDMMQH